MPGGILKTGLACLLAILGNATALAETEFDKMLAGKPFDRGKLLDEVEKPGNQSFLRSAEEAVFNFEISSMALILPLDAPGFVGEVANAFLEGFIHAAERGGAIFELETYRTDGGAHSGLEAYRQAVSNGAGMVVGPLLRGSVEFVSRLPVANTVPTILLQEPPVPVHAGQIGSAPLYSFPLGGEVEIMQLAAQASSAGTWSVFVMVDDSDFGRRLEKTFNKAWRLVGNSRAKIRTVVGQESWKSLHDEVRDSIAPPAKGKEEGSVLPRFDFHAVFAAGSAEFASQTRANTPSAVPVYVLSSAKDGLAASGRNILSLNGIRFFEMPYVLSLRQGHTGLVAADYANGLPLALQRYVAAGVDAYELAAAFGKWGLLDNWEHEGQTGLVTLASGRFLRQGRLLELVEGVYIDISPVELPTPAENI